MPHPTLTRLAASRARLLAAVDALSEADFDRHLPGGWSVRDILTHVLNAEEDHCAVAEAIALGQTDRLPTDFHLDAHNAARLAERGRLSRDDLLAALESQRTRTVILFERLDDDQRARTGPHPVLGEIAAGDIFRVLALHEGLHLRDIQTILNAEDPA